MKILKYILYALLALVLLFVAMGLFTPNVQYENTITTTKSVSETWAAMNDESNLSKWLPGYQRSELISGTASTVGAVSNIYFDEKGEQVMIKETVTEIVPNEKLAMDFSMDFMDMEYEMTTTNTSTGTQITTQSKVTGNGFFARCLVALMKGSMSGQEDDNLANLKKVIEEDL